MRAFSKPTIQSQNLSKICLNSSHHTIFHRYLLKQWWIISGYRLLAVGISIENRERISVPVPFTYIGSQYQIWFWVLMQFCDTDTISQQRLVANYWFSGSLIRQSQSFVFITWLSENLPIQYMTHQNCLNSTISVCLNARIHIFCAFHGKIAIKLFYKFYTVHAFEGCRQLGTIIYR